jgi:thiamine phosphate synthase YjbQ (UPF0047 family)
MTIRPQEISLDISPEYRFEIIDITKKISDLINFSRERYQKTTYSSFHTTAGFLDQNLCGRLNHQKEKIRSYITAFQQLFPTNANYRHDALELRDELSEAQRRIEPKNADSHLTFIGSGLRNCVTYRNRPNIPVYFIELDGVSEYGNRTRQMNAMFFNNEEVVFQQKVRVPLSKHPIDSVNLRDSKLGYLEKLNEILNKYEIEKGRIDISLDPKERFAGLTVNEYETLLMTHDLVQILKNPLKFMGEKGKYLLQHPGKIPTRTKEYAKYDFVQIFNELMDSFGMSQSVFEKLLARVIALPAEKFLGVRRHISFLISNNGSSDAATIVQGRYQSPILVQWKEAPHTSRSLILTITRYK